MTTRTERLTAYLTQQAAAEADSGHARTAADLRALVRFLETVPAALTRAANVPEWDNHENDAGEPNGLGTVAATYALWIEEADEPACEHDGACQLAELAQALAPALDALDVLHFKGNR